jgi:hypothetical protein
MSEKAVNLRALRDEILSKMDQAIREAEDRGTPFVVPPVDFDDALVRLERQKKLIFELYTERDAALAHLETALKERDEARNKLENAIIDRDAARAMLERLHKRIGEAFL